MFCLMVSEMDCSARQYESVQCLAFFFYYMVFTIRIRFLYIKKFGCMRCCRAFDLSGKQSVQRGDY